jgi:hypothetical protein
MYAMREPRILTGSPFGYLATHQGHQPARPTRQLAARQQQKSKPDAAEGMTPQRLATLMLPATVLPRVGRRKSGELAPRLCRFAREVRYSALDST